MTRERVDVPLWAQSFHHEPLVNGDQLRLAVSHVDAILSACVIGRDQSPCTCGQYDLAWST